MYSIESFFGYAVVVDSDGFSVQLSEMVALLNQYEKNKQKLAEGLTQIRYGSFAERKEWLVKTDPKSYDFSCAEWDKWNASRSVSLNMWIASELLDILQDE
jgi:hypothetical protein